MKMKNELSIEEIADYILEKDLIDKNITIQVYEEIVHLGHFLNSLKPHNILEVGARGGTFLLFSKLSTGTKIAIDMDSVFKDSIYLSMIGEDFHFLNEKWISFLLFFYNPLKNYLNLKTEINSHSIHIHHLRIKDQCFAEMTYKIFQQKS